MRTVAETAAAWACSTSLIYRWIYQGRLKAAKVGYFTLIDSRAKRPSPRRGGAPSSKKGRSR